MLPKFLKASFPGQNTAIRNLGCFALCERVAVHCICEHEIGILDRKYDGMFAVRLVAQSAQPIQVPASLLAIRSAAWFFDLPNQFGLCFRKATSVASGEFHETLVIPIIVVSQFIVCLSRAFAYFNHLLQLDNSMWNNDLKFKLALIAFTAGAAGFLLMRHGMRFDYLSAGPAFMTIAGLLPFAIVFDVRKLKQFSNLLIGFLCMVGFNLCLAVLTYAGTPLNAPLADSWLMKSDAMLGVHLPSVVEWMAHHPWIYVIMNRAYYSVLPSTLLAIVVLGFDSDVRRLRSFVSQFMIAGLLTTAIYFVLPAEAPTAAFGYAATPAQQRFIEHFHSLRSGELTVISMNSLEGLITFPSFHTTWAVLLAFAFRPYKWLFLPMVVLNAAVCVSTVTTGWHYATDVLGGVVVALVAAQTTIRLGKWTDLDLESTKAEFTMKTGLALTVAHPLGPCRMLSS